MRSSFSFAALVLLRPVASLDVLVTKPVTCSSSLPISFNFTSLGENNSNILTFGQAAPVTVVVVYDGMSNLNDLDQNNTMAIDAELTFGYNTMGFILEDAREVPLCWEEEDSGCPGDGVYTFSGNYSMVLPPNDFLGWAATGYGGKITITMSIEKVVVGKCTVAVKTRRSGAYHGSNRDVRDVKNLKLSGSETFLIVLASLGGVVVLLYLVRGLSRCFSARSEEAIVVKQPLISSPIPTTQPLITPMDNDTRV